MLQIDITPFASDALEDAMRLAQTKALNSFTFSDYMNYLNYAWSDVYNRIANIDSGYYSRVVNLKKPLTKLPPFVKNTIRIFRAQSPVGYDRLIYRESGQADMRSSGTYHISGTDLYCHDVEHTSQIWLEYVPACSQIFFSHHNRDPIIHSSCDIQMNNVYGSSTLRAFMTHDTATGAYSDEVENWAGDPSVDLKSVKYWVMYNRYSKEYEDISEYIIKEEDDEGQWQLVYINCDLPYIFCSYQHSTTGKYRSGFYNKAGEWNEYNPFEFIGKGNNIRYLTVVHNDKTGMSATVKDYNDVTYADVTATNTVETSESEYTVSSKTITLVDGETTEWAEYTYDDDMLRTSVKYTVSVVYDTGVFTLTVTTVTSTPTVVIKELGWTPDTRLIYPAPEVYRYLVALLALKFSALNESNVMGVQQELVEAEYAFNAYLEKNKSSFKRIENVNPANIMDFII